jgi:hypothetical protein
VILRLAAAFAAFATGAAAQGMTCTPTRSDTERLSRLDFAWRAARDDAIKGGAARELRALGPLAEPRLTLNRPQPTPGRYQCRTIKLGAAQEGLLPYVAYGWFRCSVTLTPGGDLILRKTTGSQRPVGLICPADNPRQARFVGVLELGTETKTPRYGADPDRDMVGVVQRTGANRWRIAFPWPRYESKLDILELRRTR